MNGQQHAAKHFKLQQHCCCITVATTDGKRWQAERSHLPLYAKKTIKAADQMAMQLL